ncbi:MAG: LCP family protein [Oscillospiraceae bacterium]
MDKKQQNNPQSPEQYQKEYEDRLREFNKMMSQFVDDDNSNNNIDNNYNNYNNEQDNNIYSPNPNYEGNPQGSRTPTYADKNKTPNSTNNRQRTKTSTASNTNHRSSVNRNANKSNRTGNSQSFKNTNNNPGTKKKVSNPKQNKVIVSGNRNINNKRGKKVKKKKNPFIRFLKWLIIILLIIFVLVEALLYNFAGKVNHNDTGERLVNSGVTAGRGVTNILITGSDTRSKDDNGRTDSMILLTIKEKTKEIYMTSLMRDMYVEIPDNGWGKLNSANAFGGPELLMDTIEKNFDIHIDKYVSVDFYSFIDIVDAVGGITLDITDEEAEGMKDPMAEQNDILGNKQGTDYLSQGGKNIKVNGNQALAYARLRYVGNADFERTERQRIVISKIIDEAKTINVFKLNKMVNAALPNITTNLTQKELFELENKLPFMLGYELKQVRIPEDNTYEYGYHDGQSTLDVDFNICQNKLKEIIK